MAFVDMHIFSRDFLHFDMSLLLLTFTLRGVSNKHCLLSPFSFLQKYLLSSPPCFIRLLSKSLNLIG